MLEKVANRIRKEVYQLSKDKNASKVILELFNRLNKEDEDDRLVFLTLRSTLIKKAAELSRDENASQIIQSILKNRTEHSEKQFIYDELIKDPEFLSTATNPYGSYVLESCFKHVNYRDSNMVQKKGLELIRRHSWKLSNHRLGCHLLLSLLSNRFSLFPNLSNELAIQLSERKSESGTLKLSTSKKGLAIIESVLENSDPRSRAQMIVDISNNLEELLKHPSGKQIIQTIAKIENSVELEDAFSNSDSNQEQGVTEDPKQNEKDVSYSSFYFLSIASSCLLCVVSYVYLNTRRSSHCSFDI